MRWGFRDRVPVRVQQAAERPVSLASEREKESSRTGILSSRYKEGFEEFVQRAIQHCSIEETSRTRFEPSLSDFLCLIWSQRVFRVWSGPLFPLFYKEILRSCLHCRREEGDVLNRNNFFLNLIYFVSSHYLPPPPHIFQCIGAWCSKL